MNESTRIILQDLIGSSGGMEMVDHVWIVDEHEPGSVLTPLPQGEGGPNKVYFVDLYSPGRLMLFIPETGAYTAPPLQRMLTLDSNMSTGFKKFVLEGERDTTHVAGIERLIDYAIVHRYGVLPAPYMLETIFHNGIDGGRADCLAIVEAVLRLYHMDVEVFRSCRSFSYSKLALENLEKRYGTSDFHAAASAATNELLDQKIPIRAHYFMSYLAVLALIDIGLKFTDAQARITAFDELLLTRVGGSYPRLMLLARQFYYGKISGWIKVEPGSNNYDANGIRGAGFDVALTMVNEDWLQVSDPLEPFVLMLVTHDRELAKNAPIIRLEAMSLLKDGNIRVRNPWDETLVGSIFGARAERIRSDIEAKLRSAPKVEIPPLELIKIIREFEQRLNLPPSRLSSLAF